MPKKKKTLKAPIKKAKPVKKAKKKARVEKLEKIEDTKGSIGGELAFR